MPAFTARPRWHLVPIRGGRDARDLRHVANVWDVRILNYFLYSLSFPPYELIKKGCEGENREENSLEKRSPQKSHVDF